MFEKVCILGEGAYGTVYKVKSLKTSILRGGDGARVALNKLPKKLKKLAKEFISEQRDGIDQWNTLMNGSPSPRTEFLYNIDPLYRQKGYPRGNAGIRYGFLNV